MKYVKIQKFDEEGDIVIELYEPLSIEHLTVVIEDEFITDAEAGQQLVLTVVEMSKEEYETISANSGY